MISPESLQGIEAMGKIAQGLLPYVKRSGETPQSIAGRLIGLGKDEPITSVPKWAWVGVGAIAGAALALKVWPAIQRKVG